MQALFDQLQGTHWRLLGMDDVVPVPVARLWFGKGWCSWKVVNTSTAAIAVEEGCVRLHPTSRTLIGSGAEAMAFDDRVYRLMIDRPLAVALNDSELVVASSSTRLRFASAPWPTDGQGHTSRSEL